MKKTSSQCKKIVSIRQSGLLNKYFSNKAQERNNKIISCFIFILGMFRFIYLAKTKQLNPVPYIMQLMNHEHGRQLLLQYRNTLM
jgi:hypothetical protein